MKKTMFIQNVKCGGCAHTIKTKLERIKNVSNVEIIIEEGVLAFDYDTLETMEFVKKTLKNIGYPEQGQENTIGSKAKSYVSCAIGKMIS